MITLVGFTVETLEDPAQLHSGTKALTLGPGQEGQIISNRGLQFLQLYAGETTGAGRIEVRGIKNIGFNDGTDRHTDLVLGGDDANGVVEGLPANISPGANPTLYSWVGDSGSFFDTTDLDFHSGIQNVKFLNVTGKLVIDDLGFTLTDFPSNNTVYEEFDTYGAGDGEFEPIILGMPPYIATIEGGAVHSQFARFGCEVRSAAYAYGVTNGVEATITFETPAYKIDVFATQGTPPKEGILPDGFIDVYDTQGNLVVTIDNLESTVDPLFKPGSVNINADDLGIPGGISRIVLRDHPTNNTEGTTCIDDFGYTPIGAPGTGSEGPPPATAPSITTQPTSQEVASGASASLSVAANGNVFDQILLTGETIQLQARPNQITRVSFMDENEDIVQVEFSGNGTFTVTLDPATFLPPAVPPRYNQAVEYVTGKPSVVIDGADANTFFSIFTVGRINAFNQALFPEGQVYDAQADVSLLEVVNSTGLGGVQLSNTVFSGSTGKVGIDARGVPIAVRLTVGDIDASGDAVPHLLFGEGSFTVAAGNPGLRITGGDLVQTNGASIVVAESGSTTRGFDRLITQNNFKSDNTPQPTRSINATFTNEDGDDVTVEVDEITIE